MGFSTSMKDFPPETRTRTVLNIIWLIGASLLPLVLVLFLGLNHILQSRPDYAFRSLPIGLIFYGAWGAGLAISSQRANRPVGILKILFFIFAVLGVNFLLLLLKMTAPLTGSSVYFYLKLVFVSFAWCGLHLLLARGILKAPFLLGEFLLGGILAAVVGAGYYLLGWHISNSGTNNPNMLTYSLHTSIQYFIIGVILTRMVMREPLPEKSAGFRPGRFPLIQTLMSLIPWFFTGLLVYAAHEPSVQKCGDPLIGCFIVALIGGVGILLFSGTALLWGAIRIPPLQGDLTSQRINFALMILSGLPLCLSISILSYSIFWP